MQAQHSHRPGVTVGASHDKDLSLGQPGWF